MKSMPIRLTKSKSSAFPFEIRVGRGLSSASAGRGKTASAALLSAAERLEKTAKVARGLARQFEKESES